MPTKLPKWAAPVGFVVIFALFLLLSNQSPTMANGSRAVTSYADYDSTKTKMEGLSLPVLQRFDAGTPLTADDFKNLRKASDMIDNMIAFQPTVSGLSFLSGKIHHALGEDVLAEQKFRQCTFDAPQDAKNHPERQKGIIEDAAEASYQLALLTANRPEQSLAAADAAVKVQPNSSDYLTARASALNELRRKDEAKADLERALALDPKNKRAKTLLDFIQKG